jgi:hypothetical protein
MIRRLLQGLRSAAPRGSRPAVDEQLQLVNAQGQPNISDLWRATKDIEMLRLSVKALGYELARALEPRLQAIPVEPAKVIGLDSKPATQNDLETRWCRGWCAELRERPRYHRRIWEFTYILQALFEGSALQSGAKVLALGSPEPAVLSHLARADVRSTVSGSQAPRERDDLIDQATFHRNVHFREALGGALTKDLTGFDACWSVGQAGAMGSIRAGMDFIHEAMTTVKPGGLAVHLFDFNFADDERTIDNWSSVLFQRRHIEALSAELKAAGHTPARLDFHVGHQPMDRFIDLPPFDAGRTPAFDRLWRDGWQSAHLKVAIDGFAVTSFGLICRRASN